MFYISDFLNSFVYSSRIYEVTTAAQTGGKLKLNKINRNAVTRASFNYQVAVYSKTESSKKTVLFL